MDRLALHIEYLLLRHECVVVPDFGAFLAVRQSSTTDEEKGIVSPMTREVRFNGALRHDDGMLASSYARRERVSYAEGRDMLRRAVDQLRSTLEAEGESAVGRLGIIMADNEGNLSFRPLETPEETTARMGFIPVSYKPHKVEQMQPGISAAGFAAVANKAEATQTEKDSEASEKQRQFDTVRNYYLAVNKRFAHVAAMIAVITVLAISVILPFNRNMNEDQASIMPVRAIAESVQSAKSARPAAPTASQQAEVQAPATPQADEPASDDWHLIVATFHTAAEADKYIATHNDRGYSLYTVASKRLHRVSARSGASKESLLKELNSTAFHDKFPEAWIYHSTD